MIWYDQDSMDPIQRFQKEVLDWYQVHKRDLPWRKTRDPYAILVSEVMSQQTQISRVIDKYVLWIERFPTIEVLARASKKDVLQTWSGLGYNRRGIFLHECAKKITNVYHGIIPTDVKTLKQLPGIGEYTASAIMCFAFDAQVPVIDTNVKKIITIYFQQGKVPDKKNLEDIALQILPKGKAYEWNQALMDFASANLKKEKIPLPKQKTFKGSDRYYRGAIIRSLLINDALYTDLRKMIGKDIDPQRFASILKNLERDKLVKRQKDRYSII